MKVNNVSVPLVLLLAPLVLLLLPRAAHGAAPTSRIVGGNAAPRSISRHIANLITSYHNSSQNGHCTATILSAEWLLTAAHCMVSPTGTLSISVKSTYAMVGTSTSAHRAEHMPRHAFFASQILIPRAYKAGGVDNRHDVALVKLSQRVPRALFRAARLAGGAERPRGNEALVAGFGALGEGMKMAAKLKIAKLQVLNHRQCEQREMQPYRKYLRSELQLCAVSMGWPFRGVTDTCHGDSGGPLFEMRRGRLVQFGVTSFGSSVCGQPGAVAWYTNVATYRKMILDTITNGKGKWRRFA